MPNCVPHPFKAFPPRMLKCEEKLKVRQATCSPDNNSFPRPVEIKISNQIPINNDSIFMFRA